MRRVLAITTLTWKAAFRFRLFWVLAVLLGITVVGLPLLIKDDGTARGFTQILLTYTLTLITTLLGFATVWIGCGTLAGDIEDGQMQVVAVKPIARWQIWLGKWLGLCLLNGALLLLSGGSVYALLQYRARQLPSDQQTILRNEIFVSRGSLKPQKPDLDQMVEEAFQRRIKEVQVPPEEYEATRRKIREQLEAWHQVVPPNTLRRWIIDLGVRTAFLRDQPLFLRFKFHAAKTNLTGTYLGLWKVGPPDTAQAASVPMSLAADTFHEIQIPPNLWDENGRLTIDFINHNETALLFPLEDGIEVLYREGGFTTNFLRGLAIIFCWLAMLAALGLCASSFMSFPVAVFCCLSLLIVALSSGTLSSVVSEGTVAGVTYEAQEPIYRVLDTVLLPVFRIILGVVNSITQYSPVDALSTGRSIGWDRLLMAFGQIVLLFGGLMAGLGMFVFTRRELAAAQQGG